MFHAAMFRAPSGGGPIARETEHCGQKQIRCAADFCRGLMPTVCANIYTATDLWPVSSSRLQRRQYKFSKGSILGGRLRPGKYCLHAPGRRKCVERFPRTEERRRSTVRRAPVRTSATWTSWPRISSLSCDCFPGCTAYQTERRTASQGCDDIRPAWSGDILGRESWGYRPR